jgi:cyclopropane fatty-acyl-phospholipid synthase-like methyltransferase
VSTEDQVQSHFDADAQRFDAIYEDQAGPVRRFVDRVWRGVVRRRIELTLERLEPLAGRTVLDVGCGSGRYCIAYALRGARRVVGVDFAPAMIGIARQLSDRAGVADRCEYRVGAFPEAVPDGPFDASTAMGYFDYVPDAARHVAVLREKTTSVMVMSFPKAVEWRVPIRRLRFRMLGCPLYLYTERQVRAILEEAGLRDYDWIPLDRDYVVVARPGAATR